MALDVIYCSHLAGLVETAARACQDASNKSMGSVCPELECQRVTAHVKQGRAAATAAWSCAMDTVLSGSASSLSLKDTVLHRKLVDLKDRLEQLVRERVDRN
jgi:hypothetical protein